MAPPHRYPHLPAPPNRRSTPFKGSFADMLHVESDGMLILNATTVKVAIPKNIHCDSISAIFTDAFAAVKDQHGIDPSDFTYREYLGSMPCSGGWAGQAWTNCGGHPNEWGTTFKHVG
eukprot:1405899-Prymnesium_polylepis.1